MFDDDKKGTNNNNINKKIKIKIITSRTSSASILIKGSKICDAQRLRIAGEIMCSTDAGDPRPKIKNEGINTNK